MQRCRPKIAIASRTTCRLPATVHGASFRPSSETFSHTFWHAATARAVDAAGSHPVTAPRGVAVALDNLHHHHNRDVNAEEEMLFHLTAEPRESPRAHVQEMITPLKNPHPKQHTSKIRAHC